MNKAKISIALMLIIIGVVGRFVLVSYVGIPNFEIITVLALIAGIYLGGVYMIIVPLAIIFLSDLVIGNNYIFIFTWTAFMFIGLFGFLSNRIQNSKFKIQNSVRLALLSSIFFYLYTNFGWWLMSGMYEYTLPGLIRCYYMAIPFFRNNLMGNLIFVPVGIYVASRVVCWIENKNCNLSKWKIKLKTK
ncbi:hypothetical protein KAI56_04580 [Candidatus Parcubacteria bacterium]|nr:hypothetical protein [Candidatus Parcubacteria bacterium]